MIYNGIPKLINVQTPTLIQWKRINKTFSYKCYSPIYKNIMFAVQISIIKCTPVL